MRVKVDTSMYKEYKENSYVDGVVLQQYTQHIGGSKSTSFKVEISYYHIVYRMLYILLYCESTIRIIRSLASSTNLASQTNSPLKAIILDKDIDLHNKSQQSHLIVPYLIMSTYCPAPLSRHPVADKNVGIIGNRSSIT